MSEGPLYKLPNKVWVDLTTVTLISPSDGVGGTMGAIYTPRVFITTGSRRIWVEFANYLEACAFADSLARLVNSVRNGETGLDLR